MSEERNSRKVRQGVVVSISGDKTCVVQVHERKPHPVYGIDWKTGSEQKSSSQFCDEAVS